MKHEVCVYMGKQSKNYITIHHPLIWLQIIIFTILINLIVYYFLVLELTRNQILKYNRNIFMQQNTSWPDTIIRSIISVIYEIKQVSCSYMLECYNVCMRISFQKVIFRIINIMSYLYLIIKIQTLNLPIFFIFLIILHMHWIKYYCCYSNQFLVNQFTGCI